MRLVAGLTASVSNPAARSSDITWSNVGAAGVVQERVEALAGFHCRALRHVLEAEFVERCILRERSALEAREVARIQPRVGVNAFGFHRGDDFLDMPHLGEVGLAVFVEDGAVGAHEVHAVFGQQSSGVAERVAREVLRRSGEVSTSKDCTRVEAMTRPEIIADSRGLMEAGTDGGGRTHTSIKTLDFESSASANSATSAAQQSRT